MSFKETHDLLQTVNDLQREITPERLNRYWPGFHVLPFALYDAKTIYLANHPNPPAEFQLVNGVHTGPGRSEFIANTSIEFAGEQIGIWNLDYFDPLTQPEEVYAKMIHEMFHAYQERSRFHSDYNEMMFIHYPLTKENLTLRVQERTELLNAVFAQDPLHRSDAISRFVAYREKRRELIGDSLNYELGLETHEGTATYVEYQALRDRSKLPEPFLLAQYGKDMSGYPKDLEWFRFTCYNPGLYMGLLLDELAPEWKQELFRTHAFLYDLFLEHVRSTPVTVEMADPRYAQFLVDQVVAKRKEKIDAFHATPGFPVVFQGEMTITAFNPVQAIAYGEQVFHGMFFGFQSGDNTVLIKAPTLVRHSGENMWVVHEIFTYVTTQPVSEGDYVQIDGMGTIHGDLIEENGIPTIRVSK